MQSISTEKDILGYAEQIITDLILELKKGQSFSNQIIPSVENLFGKNLIVNYISNPKYRVDRFGISQLQSYLFNEFWLTYQTRRNEFEVYGEDTFETFERTIILVNLDRIWREQLQKMSLLREAVGWRGYGQQNPLYEYKKEAFMMFKEQEKIFRQLVIYDLLRSSIS